VIVEAPPAEYEAIYERFDALLTRNESDVDPAPLQLVCDAFLLGRRIEVEPRATERIEPPGQDLGRLVDAQVFELCRRHQNVPPLPRAAFTSFRPSSDMA